jgi:hypothetical protein
MGAIKLFKVKFQSFLPYPIPLSSYPKKFPSETTLQHIAIKLTNARLSTCINPRFKDPLTAKNGFWITKLSYNLRPELLESYYYAHYLTRPLSTPNSSSIYKEWAWEAVISIITQTRVGAGFNYLPNVNFRGGEREKGAYMESYFFSETLKYAWLVFGDGGYSLKGGWVFNTEGHPLRVGGDVGDANL